MPKLMHDIDHETSNYTAKISTNGIEYIVPVCHTMYINAEDSPYMYYACRACLQGVWVNTASPQYNHDDLRRVIPHSKKCLSIAPAVLVTNAVMWENEYGNQC